MSELEQLLAQLRAAAGIDGADWIQRQVAASLQGVQQSPTQTGPALQRVGGLSPLSGSPLTGPLRLSAAPGARLQNLQAPLPNACLC